MKVAYGDLKNLRVFRSSFAQLEYYRTNPFNPIARSTSQLSLPAREPGANRPKATLRKFSSQFSLFEPKTNKSNKNRPFSGLSLNNLNELLEYNDGSVLASTLNRVVAQGFPWTVGKAEILEFFKGIQVLNGEDGIRIEKNVAVDAFIDVATAVDHDNALSRNGRIFDSQVILGKWQ